MTFSSNFLHAVTFLHVLHLDILRRQIEIETISLRMAIMLDHPWQSLYTQYGTYTHSTTVLCDTSKTVQNEIITICGNLIRQKVLKSVCDARFFSVIAGEATDAANHEQLSITIRFVNKNESCERFLGFLKCETGISGEAIADNILSQLNSWQLPASLLRCQAYDGAGSMSGHTRGAARINAKYPKALYTHCASYRLNLCIVKCCI